MAGISLEILFGLVTAALMLVFMIAWYATSGLSRSGKWVLRLLFAFVLVAPVAWFALEPSRLARVAGNLPGIEQPARSGSSENTKSTKRYYRRDRSETAAPPPLTPPSPGTSGGATEREAAARPAQPERAAPGSDDRVATRSAAPDQTAKWDVVPIFYGTDRKQAPEPRRINYSSERGKRLELGRALVTIPKIHQVPALERPWVYKVPFTSIVILKETEDPAKHFTLKDIQVLSEEQFLALIRTRLAGSSRFKNHAFIFVHGFNTSFDYALYRTAQLSYDLKFDGAPFVYSWPSRGEISPTAYSYDRESSEQAEPHLKKFVQLVASRTGATSVSIIAHSMGNKALLPVLRDFRRSMPEGVKLSQIILAAPDVDRDGFEFVAQQIKGVSTGITLYADSNDWALDVSRKFWGGVPRAGDVPLGGPVVISGIDTIDVTATSTEIFSLNHSGYAEKSALLNDIQLLLQTGERPPEKRIPILQRVKTNLGDYWKYPG